MTEQTERWIIGLFVSLGVGFVAVEIFLRALRRVLGVGRKDDLPQKSDVKGVPPWFTGIIERQFFTVLIACSVPGVPPAMMGWIAIKLATNWNHPDWKMEDDPSRVPEPLDDRRRRFARWRVFAFTALLAGLVSMLFAAIGGLIAQAR